MKVKTFEEQAPSTVLMRSPADWRGLRFSHLKSTPISFIRRGVNQRPTLALTVAGQTGISWRVGATDFQHQARVGTLIYLDRDFVLENISSTGNCEVLQLELDPQAIDQLAGSDLSEGALAARHLPHHIIEDEPHVSELLLAIASEIRNGCPSGALYAQSMSLAVASYYWGKHAVRHTLRAKNGLSSSKLLKIKEFVRANLEQDLSLVDMAEIAGLSPRHFCHCFKAATGESPYQYLLGARIDEARRLLRGSDLPVTEVALSTGFSGPSHFSASFRKVTGLSPSQFRAGA